MSSVTTVGLGRTLSPCEAECKARLPRMRTHDQAFLSTMHHAVIGTLYASPRDDETFAHCRHTSMECHTMLTPWTLRNFGEAVEHAVANQVEGDIVEMGVWRGGGCMYVKALLEVLGESERRSVHLFDVFDATSLYKGRHFSNVFGRLRANSVQAISTAFRKFGLLDDRVHFHAGSFNDTARHFRLAATPSTRIAVLRIDGNFYTSYEDCMYNLYSFVPVGGLVIMDDFYDHPNVRAFWRDFRKDYSLSERMSPKVPGPGGVGWFRKQKDIRVDWLKKRFV